MIIEIQKKELKTISLEEVMVKAGITQENIDDIQDIELE